MPHAESRTRRILRRILIGGLLAGILLFAAGWYLLPFRAAPLRAYPAAFQLTDREGGVLRTLLGPNDVRCLPVALTDTGRWAGTALIAAEDKRFHQHPGIDPLAILRASLQNAGSLRVVSGASTLSTQVIRMTEPRRRTLGTKGIEAVKALKMERVMNKEEILEQYLNRAPFGSNLHGIQAAARAYYDKDASELSLAEASLLMGLPQSPSRLRPDRHPEKAMERRRYVLERMRELGAISDIEEQRAADQAIDLHRRGAAFHAPHFCDLIVRGLKAEPVGDGGPVNTTLDRRLQDLVEWEVASYGKPLDDLGARSAAVVILEVSTGAVRAMVGSRDYFDAANAGQVNGAAARRSPGSTLKPFAFAFAFERGICTPASVVADVPTAFVDYDPANYDLAFRGLTTAREALVQSLNIPALRLTQAVGLEDFTRLLRRVGLRTIDRPAAHYGISLVLGTAEVTLLDLVNAYACLARGGNGMPSRLLAGRRPPATTSLLSPEACWLVADILGGDERSVAVTGHAADIQRSKVAWKTGTSTGHRDAWTVAYNPEYVVGVWVGNPDGSEVPGLSGIDTAAPLALSIFRRLYHRGEGPWFERPPGVAHREVCVRSGSPATSWCPGRTPGAYVPGVSEPLPCRIHGPAMAGAGQPAREQWPADVGTFLRERGLAASSSAKPGKLEIRSPVDGATYRRITDSSAGDPVLVLRSMSEEACDAIFWYVDGRYFSRTGQGEELEWPLEPGDHLIACSDGAGRSAHARITVE